MRGKLILLFGLRFLYKQFWKMMRTTGTRNGGIQYGDNNVFWQSMLFC